MSFFFVSCQPSEDEALDETAKKNQKVSLQLQWVTQAQFAGYYVALEKGWYKDAGIDLVIHPGGPDIVPVDLVSAGSRDFGTTLLADLTAEIQKGKPVISIAQIQQNNGLRLLAKRESNIRGPEDFAGKKIGVWLGGWEVQFNALLALENILPEKVNVISQGFSMRPFLEDRLDVASAMIYNEYNMVLEQGFNRNDLIIIDYADYGLAFPGDVLFTSQNMRIRQPDLCLKMVTASLKGWKYALDHHKEAAEIVVKYDKSGVAEFDHQLKMMKEISILVKADTRLGYVDSETLSRMIQLLLQYKVLESSVPEDKIFTSQFIRNPEY